MRRLLLLSLAACSADKFTSAEGGITADAATDTITADVAAPRFCASSTPPKGWCEDFEDGVGFTNNWQKRPGGMTMLEPGAGMDGTTALTSTGGNVLSRAGAYRSIPMTNHGLITFRLRPDTGIQSATFVLVGFTLNYGFSIRFESGGVIFTEYQVAPATAHDQQTNLPAPKAGQYTAVTLDITFQRMPAFQGSVNIKVAGMSQTVSLGQNGPSIALMDNPTPAVELGSNDAKGQGSIGFDNAVFQDLSQ